MTINSKVQFNFFLAFLNPITAGPLFNAHFLPVKVIVLFEPCNSSKLHIMSPQKFLNNSKLKTQLGVVKVFF